MRVVVGRVTRSHGLRGEVGVEVRTDEPWLRFAPGATMQVESAADTRTLTVAGIREHGKRMLVQFEQIRDRGSAESLHGVDLSVEVDERERPDDPEEYYDRQLIGLRVHTEGGGRDQPIGTVADVLHLPTQDTLSITVPGSGEVLVPFVTALVPRVRLDDGYLVVADVPGLLDPHRASAAEAETPRPDSAG